MAMLRTVLVSALALLAAGCIGLRGGGGDSSPSIDVARDELLGYVVDVPGATAHRYHLTDDLGHEMDTAKVIQLADTGGFVAVYHWWTETRGFTVSLATSDDLVQWTWRVDLARYASMPYVAPSADGGFVVAWEQEPPTQDESHVRLALYPTWGDLLAGMPSRVFDAERRLSSCAEGTPNIYAASSAMVDFGFHYFAQCESDREARGTTDWETWEATPQPLLDRAALSQGYRGSIGDRDAIEFRGYRFTFLEAQFTQDDWRTFRVLEYDEEVAAADRLSHLYPQTPLRGPYPEPPATPSSYHVAITTHGGSYSFTNLSITEVELGGRPAIVVCVFIPGEGAAVGEAGELIYYRTVDGA